MDCTLFDTAVGQCGLAWTGRGIRALQLPESTVALTVDRLWVSAGGPAGRGPSLDQLRAQPTELPAPIAQAVAEVRGLLEGQPYDLRGIELDLGHISAFERRVYEATRRIPAGQTLTYGELAQRIEAPGASRAVGRALGRNPYVIIVPCHRILAAGGRAGGFSAHGGLVMKMRLLAIEAKLTSRSPSLFDDGGDFDFDPAVALEHLRTADPQLAELMARAGPFRMQVDRLSDVFVALARAIVGQQLSGAAAATIFTRLRALFPNGHLGFTAAQLQRVGDERLRQVGLSRAKLAALRDLAERQLDGRLPDLAALKSMSDDEVVSALTEVRGIGRWTAQMLLMFRLGRSDVLPIDDLGIRQGYALTFPHDAQAGDQVVSALEKRAQCWRPYRSAACWYLWRALDLARVK